MAIQQIVQFHKGSPASAVLTDVAHVVVVFDEATHRVVQDVTDTLHAHKIAVGLAAPQIGVALKIAVVNLKTEGFTDIVLINPQIVGEAGKKDKKMESCMSLRNLRGEVIRRNKLDVEFQDQNGEKHFLSADGFLARVLAHEIDHLSGKLYTDRMSGTATVQRVDFDEWEEQSQRPSRGTAE